jgi:hypothetical protein
VYLFELIKKLGPIQRRLLQDLGREPTSQELAKRWTPPWRRCDSSGTTPGNPPCWDQTLGDEGDYRLGEFIEDSQAVVALDAVTFTQLKAPCDRSWPRCPSGRPALSGCAMAWPTANRAPGPDRPRLRAHPGTDPAARVHDDD